MSFSIYDLDNNVLELLNLENFLGGLTVNEFVEKLSRDHSLKGAEVNKLEYLDPKPYIRTFESTLRELKVLNEKSSKKSSEIDKEVEEHELKHSKNVMDMSVGVGQITHQFEGLDESISAVSGQINPLGKELTRITTSRDRSNDVIFLVRAYHGFFTKEKYEPLELLRSSKKYEDRLRCTEIVKDLLNLSKKIASPDLPRTEQTVTIVEKFCESMERQLLSNFDAYYSSDEYELMREVANILFEFNGGANVIQVFLNKHDFISEAANIEEDSLLDNEAAWIKLSDPNYGGEIKDDSIESLMSRLKMSVKAQARIVQQVFENVEPVLRILIQRVYAQIIQNNVSSLLQYSTSFRSLAHVRVLHYLYVLIGDFSKDIKEFFSANDLDKNNELSIVLDQCNFDLFIEYISDEAYFNKEKKNLEETIYNIAQEYNIYNDRIISAKALETRIGNAENADTNSKSHDGSERLSLHLSESRRLNQFKNFMKTKIAERRNSLEDDKMSKDAKENLLINVGNVETVIKSLIESVARVLEITPGKSSEYILEILEIVIFDFGRLYISAGLEVAYELVRQESYKSTSTSDIDFVFLESFSTISEIMYLMASCVRKVVLPCVINSPTVKKRMSLLANAFTSRCELGLNLIMEETLKLISSRITFLLGKQKKKDFICETIIEDDTEACEDVSMFMVKIEEEFSMNFNGDNLKNILSETGQLILDLLLEHYKKFAINSTGGIVLTRDVIRFQSVIDTWGIPELSEKFQILKEIGNLFTVRPTLINSLVTEGRLVNLKPLSIRQYISKRTDFNPSYIDRLFGFR